MGVSRWAGGGGGWVGGAPVNGPGLHCSPAVCVSFAPLIDPRKPAVLFTAINAPRWAPASRSWRNTWLQGSRLLVVPVSPQRLLRRAGRLQGLSRLDTAGLQPRLGLGPALTRLL